MTLREIDTALGRNSYYAASLEPAAVHTPLQGTHSCDVAIVGGGLAGLSAALELADKGLSVRVLEAQRIGSGASGRNGGQVIHGLACDITEIEMQLGLPAARQVFGMSLEAIALIHERRQRFAIDCDWRDGFLNVAMSPRKAKELQEGADHLEQDYTYPMRRIDQQELPQWLGSQRYVAAVHDPRSGHLHPLKYTRGLAAAAVQRGVHLHEDSAVTALTSGPTNVLKTAQGELRARQVLLAGNVHLQGLHAPLHARIMPVGSYIIASAPLLPSQAKALIPCNAAVCDNNVVLDYYRLSADNRLLYGGRTGYGMRPPRDWPTTMRRRMVKTFPSLADTPVDYAWGGFVDVSLNRAPDFGRLAEHSNVYYLQGFSGHGLALTGLAGKLVAQAIAGDAARFDVFARLKHRPFPGGRWLRSPALTLGMAWYRLQDAMP